MTSKHWCRVRACIWASLRSNISTWSGNASAGIADLMSASPICAPMRTAHSTLASAAISSGSRALRANRPSTPAGSSGTGFRSGRLQITNVPEPIVTSARESAGSGTSTGPSPVRLSSGIGSRPLSSWPVMPGVNRRA
jgi:hypothetical protein